MKNKNLRRWRWACCCLLPVVFLWAIGAGAQADASGALVVVGQGGSLFALAADGSTQSLSANTPGGALINPASGDDLLPAPDGSAIFYRDTPQGFEQAFSDGVFGNIGEAPADLYLVDLNSGAIITVADHAGVERFTRAAELWDRPFYGMAWSPDSRSVVYFERRWGTDAGGRLLLFDLTTRETRLLFDTAQAFGSGWAVDWLEAGILLRGSDMLLLSPQGDIAARTYLNEGLSLGGEPSQNPVWYDGREYITFTLRGERANSGVVRLFDPLTGTYLAAEGVIAGVSATAPETSLRLMGGGNDNRAYEVRAADGTVLWTRPTAAPFPDDLALAPDGQQFALILLAGTAAGGNPVLLGSSDGTITTLPVAFSVNALDWGALAYHVVGLDGGSAAAADPALELIFSAEVCGTGAPSPLTAGGSGRVLPGDANRLRSAPDPDAPQIGSIPAGAVFRVLAGQQGVCRGGVRWAQVEYDSVQGWTAENVGTTVFVEAAE